MCSIHDEQAFARMLIAGRGLAKRYGSVTAVSDATVEVSGGEFIVVLGRSGSGKSSLLSMLGGLSRPSAGQVLLDGRDLWTLGASAQAELRGRLIGFVFQFSGLLPTLRVVDNVALPALLAGERAAEVQARAAHLLSRVGLGGRQGAYPSELSGGEQRRVAVARALIRRPPLLLLDEPTADLDEETEAAIMALLLDDRRERGTAMVLVTHSPELAHGADRVLRVSSGRVEEAPPPASSQPIVRSRVVPVASEASYSEDGLHPPVRGALPLHHAPAGANALEPASVQPLSFEEVAPAPLLAASSPLSGRLAMAVLLLCLVFLGLDIGVGKRQKATLDARSEARRALERAAFRHVTAELDDIEMLPDGDYRLRIRIEHPFPNEPLFLLGPTVRAFVQVGFVWQEVPLEPDAPPTVHPLEARKTYGFKLRPKVDGFEEVLPGYYHVRFTNAMLLSPTRDPSQDVVAREDNYYVYLKPFGADDADLKRRNNFSGPPPLWIPMPPH